MILESSADQLAVKQTHVWCDGESRAASPPALSGREGGDSGVESGDETYLSPRVVESIVSQVESYFSDENLRKDAFLLKHIKRNRDGFVSLKLISSLRRVKSLTKNWQDVATAIQKGSKSLILNSEATKVKRASLLPLDLLLMSRGKRIVLVYGLTNASIESVSETFTGLGNMTSIRLFSREEDIEYMARTYPTVAPASSALVEFESVNECEKVIEAMEKRPVSWRSTVAVVPFGSPVPLHSIPTSSFHRSSHANKSPARSWTCDSRPRSGTVTDRKADRMFPLRQKSRSCNGFEDRDNRPTNTPVHRQPLGPDGTRGFHSKHF